MTYTAHSYSKIQIDRVKITSNKQESDISSSTFYLILISGFIALHSLKIAVT